MDKIEKVVLKSYDIKIDYLVPTTITYKVSAENEHEALKQVEKIPVSRSHIKHNLQRKIKIKAKVFQASTSIVKYTKTYRSI